MFVHSKGLDMVAVSRPTQCTGLATRSNAIMPDCAGKGGLDQRCGPGDRAAQQKVGGAKGRCSD